MTAEIKNERLGIIYLAFNIISLKGYIGKTIQTLKIRKIRHYNVAQNHFYKFANALRYYKKEDWIWTILYDNIPESQIRNMEKWCIANYNTYYNGYNSTFGGEDNPMSHIENREKLKISMEKAYENKPKKERKFPITGRKRRDPHTEETKNKMRLTKIGSKNHRYGKQNSEDTRNKISEKLSKKVYEITTPMGQTIITKNLKKFCRDNNLDDRNMYAILYGKKKSCKGHKVKVVK